MIDIGVQRWDKGIWLYPIEWYNSIPEDYEIVTIRGKTKLFQKGLTDKEMRYGALSFGFRKERLNHE